MYKNCDAISTHNYGPRTLSKRVFSCTLTGNGNKNQAFSMKKVIKVTTDEQVLEIEPCSSANKVKFSSHPR